MKENTTTAKAATDKKQQEKDKKEEKEFKIRRPSCSTWAITLSGISRTWWNISLKRAKHRGAPLPDQLCMDEPFAAR